MTRPMRNAWIGVTACVLIAALVACPAWAASSCRGVDTALTDARRQAYAARVATALNAAVKPSQITIQAFMREGVWSAVSVSTPVSDDGVLFFVDVQSATRFKDVWGGWAQPSERPQLIAWARKLGVPAKLAQCFARLVT